MLVLTRKCGQKLIINDDIEILVIESRGDTVKIGVKAPKNVSIFREEIYDEIKKANVQSSKNIKVSDVENVLNLVEKPKFGDSDSHNKLKSILNTSTTKNN